MFVPADFVETDLAWLDRLLARDAFVTVVTTGSDGLPQVTLLPVVYQRDGEDILIEGHWARPNPQAGHAGPALVLVHGPHGYVSPGWYPDNAARSGVEQPKAGPQGEPQGGGEYKQGAARVPTWNYAAAELRGTLEPVTDPEALIDMLDRLSAKYEAQVGGDWALLPIEPRQRRMLAGIIGFRFRAQQVQIKLKLSQNHPEANQHGVIDALSALDSPPSHELAQWMRWKQGTPQP
ncbi:FMN-binding negative transcriptional regulator [Stenotrophomonas sp. AB1(2024)]|uniref:FMN-binding negative transcriptional regulator n=1 Tax=Stenotrophomonas sp. AB1(2024) TaxID=3132215 RepID=UPI0030B58FDF